MTPLSSDSQYIEITFTVKLIEQRSTTAAAVLFGAGNTLYLMYCGLLSFFFFFLSFLINIWVVGSQAGGNGLINFKFSGCYTQGRRRKKKRCWKIFDLEKFRV